MNTRDPESAMSPLPERPRQVARTLRLLLRDVLKVCAVLGGTESGLQLFAPRYREHLFDAEFTGGRPLALNSQDMNQSIIPRVNM